MSTYQSNIITTKMEVKETQNVSSSIEVKTTTHTTTPNIINYMGLTFFILIVIIGIIGFIKSIHSRKYYKCPICGESFRSENMESKTCKVCGSNLEETFDKNITDKTK